jgi:hypothetical protein
VPPNTNGTSLPNHLCALVTQTTRGELAVVDLTSGNVVDEDRSTPGINFIPVGSNPTDVAVAPDAKLTFVASADPNKPAIYAIDNTRILGDSTGVTDAGRPAPLRLTDLSACALPQAPQALAIAPLTAGGGDGGDDAGAGAGEGGNGDDGGATPSPRYAIIALLRGSTAASAKVVAFDPSPFTQGAAPLKACVPLGATAVAALPAMDPGPPGRTGPLRRRRGPERDRARLPLVLGERCGGRHRGRRRWRRRKLRRRDRG